MISVSRAALLAILAASSGCGMHTALMNGGNDQALTAGSSGGGSGGSSGGTSSGGTSSGGSSGGPTGVPLVSKIVANTTLAFVFLTTAPTDLGIASGTVVNAASYTASVASGGLAVLIASSLPVQAPASDMTFPTTLGGITLTVGGVTARLYLATSTQVSFQVPPSLAPGTYPVVVSQGSTQALATNVVISKVAPALFTAASNGTGAAAGETITFSSPSWTGPVIFSENNTTGAFSPVAVDAGAWIVLYGTGWENAALSQLSLTLGSADFEPAAAGAQGTYPGIDVVVAQVPASLAGAQAATLSTTLSASGEVSNTAQVCIASAAGSTTCP